ncbi:MAG: tetratricopeptide repeat protein [Candidatus Krumholzibacteria bacterium]|nr:tetratricopeptide repeat protein [Candidatus Krumholzibacteria bacterium]
MRRAALICLIALLLAACAGPRREIRWGEQARVVTHKVLPGETWESIAGEFYRDQGRGGALARYNNADPAERPAPGTGVRVPLTEDDIEGLGDRLEAAAAYNEGIALAERGAYAEAVERFTAAAEADPSMLDASFNLAVCLQNLGMHDRAAGILEDLAGRDRDDPRYHFALGHSRYRSGDPAAAARSFEAALRIDPSYGEALYALAVAREQAGEAKKAREAYLRYLSEHPGGEWAGEARTRLQRLESGEGKAR